MFKFFTRKANEQDAAHALYAAAVDQARSTPFYERFGVADTLDGRFELVTAHIFLILRRLKGAGDGVSGRVAQELTDITFRNFDGALREVGVGDLAIARKIRKLAENFYGRLGAYETAFEAENVTPPLEEALARNVYETNDKTSSTALASYLIEANEAVHSQSLEALQAGTVTFPALEEQ